MTSKPQVSVITASYNSQEYIIDNLKSVSNQGYSNIEHIIIDGSSTDQTCAILERYDNKHKHKMLWISEEDQGIYHAMNKGINLSHGEVIGILNSDDFYSDEAVISKVVSNLREETAEICWGDMVYVERNKPGKIVRFWQSFPYKDGLFEKGWEPPHPTVFVRKDVYEDYGKYDLEFPISADYEFLLRMLKKYNVESCYIPDILVKMRTGGTSDKSLKNRIRGNIEIYRAWKKNNLNFPKTFFFRRIFGKAKQFFNPNSKLNSIEESEFQES